MHSEAQSRLQEQQALIDDLTNERDCLLQASGLDHTPSSSHSTEEIEFQLQGLRDALDNATREKRVLVNELNVERERGRRAQAREESLSETATSKTQLEEVGLRFLDLSRSVGSIILRRGKYLYVYPCTAVVSTIE